MYNLDEHIGKIPKKLELTGVLIIILILFSLYSLFFIIKYPIDIQCNNVIDETNSKMLFYVDKKYYPKLNALNNVKRIKIYYHKDKPEEKLIYGEIIDMNFSNNDYLQILIKTENMNFNYSPHELTIIIKNNLIKCIMSKYE